MMWAIIIIGVVVWVALWLLQFHYAHRTSLAQYPLLGDGAWDRGDIVLHGFIGFFLAPLYFVLVIHDYFQDKERIEKFHMKKDVESGEMKLKKVESKSPAVLKAAIGARDLRIQSLERHLDQVNITFGENKTTINELTTEKNSLKAEIERLEELTKSVQRFGLMDFDEPKK